MEEDAGFEFPNQYPNESTIATWLVGHFMPDMPDMLATSGYIYDAEQDTVNPTVAAVRLVSLADSTLGDVLYSITSEYNYRRYTGLLSLPYTARLSRPADFNGVGFDDLITLTQDRTGDEHTDIYATLDVHFGGAQFDSVPDWRVVSFYADRTMPYFFVASGFDLNGDDYDDMLVQGFFRFNPDEQEGAMGYRIYLGGSPMDTVADLHWFYDHFDERHMRRVSAQEGWALLPDVNGDGYDDWGLCFYEQEEVPDGRAIDSDGCFVFFGGEELDLEPDVILGPFPFVDALQAELVGGDFNEDGYGDIMFSSPGGMGNSIARFYFGRQRWGEQPEPDVVFREDEFEGEHPSGSHLGAVGDYNGDGADDYVKSGAYIIGGWDRGDAVDENERPPQTLLFSSACYPNPFNDSVKIEVDIDVKGLYRLDVWDIRGRILASLYNGVLVAGDHSFNWESPAAGIYMISLSSGSGQRAATKVVSLR